MQQGFCVFDLLGLTLPVEEEKIPDEDKGHQIFWGSLKKCENKNLT